MCKGHASAWPFKYKKKLVTSVGRILLGVIGGALGETKKCNVHSAYIRCVMLKEDFL